MLTIIIIVIFHHFRLEKLNPRYILKMGSYSASFSHFTEIENPLVSGFLVGCVLGPEELELEVGMKGHNA